MATASSFAGGVGAAIIGMLISTILFIGVGLPAEQLVAEFENTDIFDLPEEWASYDDIAFWMNMLYIILISPAIVGIITMFLSAIRTQEYDVVSGPEPIPQGEYSYYNVRE